MVLSMHVRHARANHLTVHGGSVSGGQQHDIHVAGQDGAPRHGLVGRELTFETPALIPQQRVQGARTATWAPLRRAP